MPFITPAIIPLVTACLFRLYLWRHECLTSKELISRYPQHHWVKLGYPVWTVIMFYGISLSAAAIYWHYRELIGDQGWFFVIALSMSSLNIWDGIFALVTDLYSASTPFGYYYFYDKEKKLAWLAKLLLFIAAATVAGSAIACFLLPNW